MQKKIRYLQVVCTWPSSDCMGLLCQAKKKKKKRITHLCNDVQVRVCNYASHLNNLVLLDIQPCHLKQEVHWHFKTNHYNCTITADDNLFVKSSWTKTAQGVQKLVNKQVSWSLAAVTNLNLIQTSFDI